MKQQIIQFQRMTSDVADKLMSEGDYKKMVNCRPNDINNKGGGVVKNIPSTLKVNTLSIGESVDYIGGCADSKRDAIIGFLRGATTLYIVSFDTKTHTESFILKSSVIDNSERVTHVGVLDDLLFWIDGAGKARKLNIVSASKDTTLNRYSANELLIDKLPPLYPPTVNPVNDLTFQGNNIRSTTFQFCYSYEYNDGERSSWSPFSLSVLPSSVGDDDITFTNNSIDVTLKTGSSAVSKILIASRKGEDRDWIMSETLDKQELSISDDTTYTYRFFNQRYIEGIDQADVLANTANPYYYFETQAISRDNFLIYGGLKDGLEHPTDIELTLSVDISPITGREPSHKFGATHEYGLVFRDENGRTSGVHARAEAYVPFYTETSFKTQATTPEAKAVLDWTITGTAPSWAKTVSLVYLGNKTMSTFVQYGLDDIYDQGKYTYIDISTMNKYKDGGSALDPSNPKSTLSPYTFNEGDRIRFITDKDGVLISDDMDTEILGYVPEVTGTSQGVLYDNIIYVDTVSWESNNIGESSLFEIYTPKKEFSDDIFYEVGQVYEVIAGVVQTSSGTLSVGDTYVRDVEFEVYESGELISDPEWDYDNDGSTGISLKLDVVKSGAGVKNVTGFVGTAYLANAFYQNTTGKDQLVTVTGTFNFSFSYDEGYSIFLRKANRSTGVIKDIILSHTVTTSPSGNSYTADGVINETVTAGNDDFLMFYVNQPKRSRLTIKSGVDVQLKVVEIPETIGTIPTLTAQSKNYSDFFPSDEHSLGRPYIELDEDLSLKNNIVYTGKYFADTDIDETNKISSTNIRYVPYEHGQITVMRVIGNTLKVLTPNKELSFYLGREQSVDANGNVSLSFSGSAIGSINVYPSDLGTENPESVMVNSRHMYYYDRKNASLVRTSPNGQEQVERFGQKTYLRDVTSRINAATAYEVFVGYNDKNEEVIFTFVIDGVAETAIFNEGTNNWTHMLELEDGSGNPTQGMLHYGENLMIYVNGDSHLSEQGVGYNNILGDQKEARIECVVNQEPLSTKVLQALSYQSTDKWGITIETETSNQFPQGQYTSIPLARQKYLEGIVFSDIPKNLKDKNGTISNLRYATGSPMRARVATLTLTNTNASEVQMDELTVNYIPSSVQ